MDRKGDYNALSAYRQWLLALNHAPAGRTRGVCAYRQSRAEGRMKGSFGELSGQFGRKGVTGLPVEQ